jgi:hypothetical protein
MENEVQMLLHLEGSRYIPVRVPYLRVAVLLSGVPLAHETKLILEGLSNEEREEVARLLSFRDSCLSDSAGN